eukprot:TRINITY_DN3863_c1_g1_i1.p1 TRINITY_DN3863_c1_g1~~TRINITY_DN3863_c1_g1_i1.p1  ORF type:complete len:100 (+),score=12.86 TRINITY_DN3863_c1_g1_i1:722-1021(+)
MFLYNLVCFFELFKIVASLLRHRYFVFPPCIPVSVQLSTEKSRCKEWISPGCGNLFYWDSKKVIPFVASDDSLDSPFGSATRCAPTTFATLFSKIERVM